MDMFEMISQLTAAFGPAGQEQPVARLISTLATPYADEITTDAMGNLIVHKKGSGPRLMLCAHMDTVGLVVSYIERDGTLRVGKLGNISPKDIRNVPIHIVNDKGIVAGTVKVHGNAKDDGVEVDDLYLDIGVESREEAQHLVGLGDMAVFSTCAVPAGNRVISPYLDNRVSCAVLLKVLERLNSTSNDLYFVFSVQEEIGLRGAKTAAFGIDPDFAIAVDVTGAYDWPGAPKLGSAKLGKGAAIKVMDTSIICHPVMVEKLKTVACKGNIPYQMDVLTRGGTDAGVIHKNRLGVVTGGVSIPCRYIHTPTECVDLRDVDACIALLTALAESKF